MTIALRCCIAFAYLLATVWVSAEAACRWAWWEKPSDDYTRRLTGRMIVGHVYAVAFLIFGCWLLIDGTNWLPK